jgi:hypothetical protein
MTKCSLYFDEKRNFGIWDRDMGDSTNHVIHVNFRSTKRSIKYVRALDRAFNKVFERQACQRYRFFQIE